MKTRADFEDAQERALILMHHYFNDNGFKTDFFYNIDREPVVAVVVEDENGEEAKYIATFDRV